MNIYLISRDDWCGYDEYDSYIIAAETADNAKSYDTSMTNVVLIGKAESHIEAGLILGSFNAG